MAKKRMFSSEVVESDNFLDNLKLSAQALYVHLCMAADDDGFINNSNRVRKSVEASTEDFQQLIESGYIIKFDSGVIVITHWRINNYIRKDRYSPTNQPERKLVNIVDGRYVLKSKDSTEKADVEVQTEIKSDVNYSLKFEEFWNAYPRKEHRTLAEQQFCTEILHGINADMLIDSAKMYARKINNEEIDKKYVRCPDTWLKDGLYTDYEVKEKPKEEPKVEEDRFSRLKQDVRADLEKCGVIVGQELIVGNASDSQIEELRKADIL